jgi:two-component system NtrC family sensor kinase
VACCYIVEKSHMSITKKVTLIVALLAGLLLAAAASALVLFREQELVDQVRLQTKLLSQVVQLSAETALDNYGHLGALEDLVSRNMAASITFFGPDARAVAPVPPEESPVVNARARRVIERNSPEEELVATGYAYRVPLRHKGKVEGAMELRVDLNQVLPEGYLDKALFAAAGLLVVFALLVGLFSRTSIGRPIDQLMNGMDQVIQGDLTAILPLDRSDEIGRIAYRFNEMTAQLRDAQEEIRSGAQAQIKLEQRLRQSEKLATIGQLAAEIAHEVGTPLNVIGGRARALARKADQPAEVRKNSEIIADQAARITKIIQQVLDLSRKRSPEKTAVDLERSVEAALVLLEYQLDQASIEVDNQVPADLPRVLGDADALQQVFINLVLNAIQAMPRGGTLAVSAGAELRRKGGLDLAEPQRFAWVAIADTGEGIPEELHNQIFEPFYSTKGEGTGLGLTVAHGIVKEHDGWIEVERGDGDGGGTTFRVHLPAEEQPAPEEEEAAEE